MRLVRIDARTVIAGALLAAACNTAPATPPAIQIGVVMPLSGDLGGDGPAWVNGMQLARREINAAGGVLGRQVEFIVRDGQTNPDVSSMQALQLVQTQHVVGLLGEAASSGSIRVYTDVAAPMHIPEISCCSTSPTLTMSVMMQAASDRYFFRTAAPDDLQALVVTDIAAHEAACTRLAILHLDDTYGAPLAAAIASSWTTMGHTVVANVAYTDGHPNYDAEVAMVAAANPDCIALIAFPMSGGIIVRTWNALPTTVRPANVHWIGTDGVESPSFPMEAGGAMAIDGFIGSVPVTDPTGNPAYMAFHDAYMTTFGMPPTPFTANSYDAAALLLLAIAQAGSTNGAMVRDGIHAISDKTAPNYVRAGNLAEAVRRLAMGQRINYDGASGPVDVDDYGNVVSDYEVWRFSAAMNQFVQVRIVPAASIHP